MQKAALALVLACCVSPAFADEPYAPFIGTYVGRAEADGQADTATPEVRDLDVTITEVEDGFRIDSITVNHHGDRMTPDVSRRRSATSFTESDISEVYRRDFARDVFATREELDVVEGDPLQWARVDGDTLLVYAFALDEDGAYELQTYRRTLDENGLALDFDSEIDGMPNRRVIGQLIRVEDVMDDVNP